MVRPIPSPLPWRPIISHRRAPVPILLLGAALLAGPAAARDSSGSLAFPNAGVICDRVGQVCYDRQGISLGLTRATYGRKAEEQVLRELGTRPGPREFRLSTGAVCSLPRKTCWDDGWSKTRVSQRLTRHLFGTTGPSPIKDGTCSLSKANRSNYYGPCDLRSETKQGINRYVVSLDDGRRFSFSNRNGRYELNDSSGNWPVRIENRNRSGVFSWADYTLVASRNGHSGSGSSASGGTGAVLGATLGALLQGLFQPAAGSGSIAAPAPGPYDSGYTGSYTSGMGMVSPPATIVFPSAGSCVTYGGPSDSFRLNLRPGQWLQVQAVDRGIAVVTPSGRSLPSAYGTGQWTLPEDGTYAVNLEVPPGEGMGVRFCLR